MENTAELRVRLDGVSTEIGILAERLKALSNEVNNYFSCGTATKEQQGLILYSYQGASVMADILADYISRLNDHAKELEQLSSRAFDEFLKAEQKAVRE